MLSVLHAISHVFCVLTAQQRRSPSGNMPEGQWQHDKAPGAERSRPPRTSEPTVSNPPTAKLLVDNLHYEVSERDLAVSAFTNWHLYHHLTLLPAEPLRNIWFFCKGTKNKGTSSTPITRFISAASIGNKVYDFSTLLLAICLGFGLAPRLFSSTRVADQQVRPSLYLQISRMLVLQKRRWINNLPRVHPP
jgi:hypothetical protein